MMISRPEVLALMKYNSLNDKKLIGDKVGLSSVRGNTHYRIEFEETIIENQTVATLSHITELSNQYQ
jgi:proteic killer suppression protein